MSRAADGLWFGKPFDTRVNGLNLVRLVLATSVLFHHSFPLTGDGVGPDILGDLMGGWAVIGFFALSGYLITASRRSKPVGTFLALRVTRIYPAFLVCNVATVTLLAPFAWWFTYGNLAAYLTTQTTPLNYLLVNLGLKMNAYDVATTPLNVPFPHVWNGSLWSLSVEFVCYLFIAAVYFLPWAYRSEIPVVLAWAGAVAARIVFVFWGDELGLGETIGVLTKFLAYFMAGAVLQVFRKRIGIHPVAALVAAVIFVGVTALAPTWGGQLVSPALAYVLLWIGSTFVGNEFFRTNDMSYGMYIYAFPMQQLLATLGAWKWGYWPFSLTALVLAAGLASASWYWVEQPTMTRVRDWLGARRERHVEIRSAEG